MPRTLNIVKLPQSVDAARRISRAPNPAGVRLASALHGGAEPTTSRAPPLSRPATRHDAGVIVYMGLVLTFRPRLAREIALFLPLHALGRTGRQHATASRA
jgi:hypothetical protein